MIMAVLGAALILKGELSEPFFNFMIGRGLLNFFIGAMLGRIYRWRKNYNEKLVGYLALVFIIINIGIGVICGYETFGNMSIYMGIAFSPSFILAIVFVPCIKRVLEMQIFQILATLSMSIYMWHFPIQIIWKLLSTYNILNIDFAKKTIWILYVVSVIAFSGIYNWFIKDKVDNAYRLLKK